MLEILKIGAAVATPLGFLGFVAALVYFVRARQLKHKEVALDKLSPEERAQFLDENLSRYRIDAANATRQEKHQLIKDEMEKRYRLAVLYTLVSAFVFVVCFGLAVYAYASVQQGNPAANDSGGAQERLIGRRVKVRMVDGKNFIGTVAEVQGTRLRLTDLFGYSIEKSGPKAVWIDTGSPGFKSMEELPTKE